MEKLIYAVSIFIAYVMFGLVLEILFTGMSKLKFLIKDDMVTEEDRLMGYISMWMIPVYGILLPLIYLPLFYLMFYIIEVPFYIRYFIWAIFITGFEILSGWFYDEGLYKITRGRFSIRPWDYSMYKDSIFNGYTRKTLIPLWGIAGIILEFYSYIVQISSNAISEHFISFIKIYF